MAGLFLIDQDGKLTSLKQSEYVSEDLFQELLEDYPDLLGGDQMGFETPRRWLFVAREAPIPDTEGGSGRWSVDHLFLDQDAIPTFVEVKRATDTRIRREVVGQMLDYAANGLRYWPVETIQGFLAQAGSSAEERLVEEFGADVDSVAYWQQLRENLSEGRIRLLFVADKIPSELLAVVEFLNTHMDHTEVLAVEIPQFIGEGGVRTLAPRVLGQTQAAIQQKRSGGRSSRAWNEDSYFDAARGDLSPDDFVFTRRYFDWIVEQGWEVVFGRGSVNGSFCGKFKIGGEDYPYPVICYSGGWMEFSFAGLGRPPFDDDAKRRELVRRLNVISNADFSEDTTTPGNKYPSRALSIFASEEGFKTLTDAILWYKQEADRGASA